MDKNIFAAKVAEYKKNPIAFCREALCFEPDDWQREALTALAESTKVSIRSGQGVGKTGMEACALLWFLCCFPFPRVVATAPTRQQLHDVLWAETAKWMANNPLLKKMLEWTKTRIYIKNYSERWFAVARTATRPENMQGFHEDNMLFIVDEASGVADPILEAILGTLSGVNNKLLLCGNPTKKEGIFYDSHHIDKDMYRRYRVSSLDSKRTNKENVASLIRKFGEHSNVVRVRVFGEFPIDDDSVFITTSLAESGKYNEAFDDKTEKVETVDIGVDVARFGDDNTVIAPKLNNTVLPLTVEHGQDTMRTANQVMSLAKEKHAKYKVKVLVKVDDTGVGGGVTDRLNEIKREQSLGWLEVVPVNLARSAKHAYYANLTTVLWGYLKEALEEKRIALPDDADLMGELTNRKKLFDSSGRIILEKKEEMKKRGLPSPDRADAVTLALIPLEIGYTDRTDGGDTRL